MDTVNLYPKTSCPCGSCKTQFSAKTGTKSSLAVRGCSTPEFFECYDRAEFGTALQPVDKTGIYELNPQLYNSKIAEGFEKHKRPESAIPCSCPSTAYLSADPRLFSATRADYLFLDAPPMDGDVRLNNVGNKKFNKYKTGYESYDRIVDGQITYYVDRSIEDAFYKPVWSEPARESSILYKDPMGAMKPEYNRTPIMNTWNPTVTSAKYYPYCLSAVQDSQSFREDIMALQQRKNNQEKWSARWANHMY